MSDSENDNQLDWEIYWLGTTASGASGDCAVLVWGDLQSEEPTERKVVVIDAGRNDNDLEKLIEVLVDEVGTDQIDLLVGTHSDRDHIGKFPKLLADERITVNQIWMRNPFNHLDVFDDEPMALTASLADVSDVVYNDEGLVVHEPKPGEVFGGAFTVLGPSDELNRPGFRRGSGY